MSIVDDESQTETSEDQARTAHFARQRLFSSRRVALRAVSPDDVPHLFRAEQRDVLIGRWRLAGWTPSPTDYATALWSGVHAQYLVGEQAPPYEYLGHVTCYSMDLRRGFGFVAVNRFADGTKASALLMEGLGLFIDMLFMTTPVRKLYFETPEYNTSDFQSAIRLGFLHEEARLRQHRYFSGRYWDLVILSMTRESWKHVRRLVPAHQ